LVSAQQPKKMPRVGYLSASSASEALVRTNAFRQGLRDLGYVEGKNLIVELRYADGKFDRLPALAAELVRLPVDVIVSAGPSVTSPAKKATTDIPIVMTNDSDPVGSGFVASLARPGRNVTGLSNLARELSGKRVEILKELLPPANSRSYSRGHRHSRKHTSNQGDRRSRSRFAAADRVF